jgi:hypothetical protein
VSGALQRTDCFLGDDCKDIFIDRNLVTKSRLDHAIALQLRQSFQGDGSCANLSLIETTRGDMKMNWRGPLIVY